jgi:transcription-repair coupling factor (superfamily II helicase)
MSIRQIKNLARSRFIYIPKKIIIRGLGIVKPQKQLNDLIDWLGTIYKALPKLELVLILISDVKI